MSLFLSRVFFIKGVKHETLLWTWDSESDAEVTAPACDEGLLRVVHQ